VGTNLKRRRKATGSRTIICRAGGGGRTPGAGQSDPDSSSSNLLSPILLTVICGESHPNMVLYA